MPPQDPPEDLKVLDFSVLHPIRDLVLVNGTFRIPDLPVKFLSLDIGAREPLVLAAHDSRAHTRLRISYSGAPQERHMLIVFEDEPASWLMLDTDIDPQDLVLLSTSILASGTSDAN